jgi:hypothetical protein
LHSPLTPCSIHFLESSGGPLYLQQQRRRDAHIQLHQQCFLQRHGLGGPRYLKAQ